MLQIYITIIKKDIDSKSIVQRIVTYLKVLSGFGVLSKYLLVLHSVKFLLHSLNVAHSTYPPNSLLSFILLCNFIDIYNRKFLAFSYLPYSWIP